AGKGHRRRDRRLVDRGKWLVAGRIDGARVVDVEAAPIEPTTVELAGGQRHAVLRLGREARRDRYRVLETGRHPRGVGGARGLAGSANGPSYQPSHAVATCRTAVRSPAAIFSAGSNTICGVVGCRNAAASRRASGARPTMVRRKRRVASSSTGAAGSVGGGSGRCSQGVVGKEARGFFAPGVLSTP